MNPNKQHIRKQIKASVKALSAERRRSEAEGLLKLVSEDEHFKAAKNILIYSPLPDEIDVTPILSAYKDSKRFHLPVVTGDTLKILPCSESTHIGAYGISEPDGTEYTDPATLDLIIVPGVGFTADGHRLGRGKGYYDRLLKTTSAYKIGVCFAVQITPSIASLHEPHDVLMDKVLFITSNGNYQLSTDSVLSPSPVSAM